MEGEFRQLTIRPPLRKLHDSLRVLWRSWIGEQGPAGLRWRGEHLHFYEEADGFVLWEVGEGFCAVAEGWSAVYGTAVWGCFGLVYEYYDGGEEWKMETLGE